MDIEKSLNKEQTIKLLRQLADALENENPCDLPIAEVKEQFHPNPEVGLEYEEEDGNIEFELEFSWAANTGAGADSASGEGGEAQKRSSRFELFQGADEQWYFHLKAANNQIILVSEGYTAKQNALKGIDSVRRHCQEDCFEMRRSKSNQPYFVLKAANGEIIGVSQMYKRQAGATKGMRAVLEAGEGADLVTA